MPLEFPCPNCQHLLRTADDKAGLSATCPACGESLWVPYAHQIGSQTNEPPPPPEGDSAEDQYTFDNDDPFATGSTSKTPAADADNPFVPDSPPPQPTDEPDAARQEGTSDEPAEVERRSSSLDVVTCEHCGTENDPDDGQCRQCAADLPPAAPAANYDGWQPRDPDVGEMLQSSWAIYTGEMGLLIGGWLLYALMTVAACICCMIPIGIMMAIFAAVEEDLIVLGVVGGALFAVPLVLFAMAILNIGFIYFSFNIVRGTSAGIGDLFYGFGEGRSLIPGALVAAVVTALAGIPTCGLAAIALWPLSYAVVYHRTTAGEALGAGFGLIQREAVSVIIIGLIIYGISFAVNLVPYVGIILMVFAMPFVETLHAAAFLRMERQRIALDRD